METRQLSLKFMDLVDRGGLVKTAKVAKVLGLSSSTVIDLAHKGVLNAFKIGGQHLFDPTDVEQFIHDRKVKPQEPEMPENLSVVAWLEAACERDLESRETAAELYKNFLKFRDGEGRKRSRVSKKAFGNILQRLGFRRIKGSRGVRLWGGLRLVSGE
jgi:excisionase family DNA binding protein